MSALVRKFGAGCRNRTCFVSLKRRVHSRICQSRKLWWVTLCPIARKTGARRGPRWNRTSLVSLKRRVHQPSLPVTQKLGAGCWNRTNTSRLSIAGSTFELILLWCAVRELNPHLLGVGQLFWSVELPARNIMVEGAGVEPA